MVGDIVDAVAILGEVGDDDDDDDEEESKRPSHALRVEGAN